MARDGSSLPRGRRLLSRAVLCLLALAFAGYLLYWFMFALDTARMEAVDTWGKSHGIVWEIKRPGGRAYVSPGRIVHPQDLEILP